ncbi:MAG: phage tail protein [Lachnospiraceae bacterium]|nr:phage tail protein [Lachnospiraceae bacterium]
MAGKAITTIAAKKKMLLARAGKINLPPIKQMAFGSGGTNADGEVLELDKEQQELHNELCRKDIDTIEIISDTRIRYNCIINENELAGESISEMALVDADGDLLTIKNFKDKGKDSDFSFTFKVNDTM